MNANFASTLAVQKEQVLNKAVNVGDLMCTLYTLG